MKMRTGAVRYGGSAYYRLIGSAHEGSPVMPGDTLDTRAGHELRGVRLLDADRYKENHVRQDQAEDPQQQQ